MAQYIAADDPQVLPGQATSLWLDTAPETNYDALFSGLAVDVVVIGGGITGLTAATLLKAEGKTVAVLEAGRIVQGVTAYSTAKVTSLHGLLYDYLIRHFGEEKAHAYADANQTAIEQISRFVEEKQIDCEFARTEAYTYTESEQEIDEIRAEVSAATSLGLPAAYVEETPMPFPVKAAIRLENQAQFHPRKYLLALARDLPGQGSYLFEQTRVVELSEGDPCVVTTERGVIEARAVIIASHFPFNDMAFYATRLIPYRYYLLAVRLAEAAPRGMFLSTEPSQTMRNHPAAGEDLLLVGGQGHRTGEGGNTVSALSTG